MALNAEEVVKFQSLSSDSPVPCRPRKNRLTYIAFRAPLVDTFCPAGYQCFQELFTFLECIIYFKFRLAGAAQLCKKENGGKCFFGGLTDCFSSSLS